jgi:hypothetical protein
MFDLKTVALLGAVTLLSIGLALALAWTCLNGLVTHLVRVTAHEGVRSPVRGRPLPRRG